MEKCENVIIRRPVSEEAIAEANKGLKLINETCELIKIGEACGLDTATSKEMTITMGILLDSTAKLAGFRNGYDMTDYLKIYGKL